jgi:hypothetical protein
MISFDRTTGRLAYGDYQAVPDANRACDRKSRLGRIMVHLSSSVRA